MASSSRVSCSVVTTWVNRFGPDSIRASLRWSAWSWRRAPRRHTRRPPTDRCGRRTCRNPSRRSRSRATCGSTGATLRSPPLRTPLGAGSGERPSSTIVALAALAAFSIIVADRVDVGELGRITAGQLADDVRTECFQFFSDSSGFGWENPTSRRVVQRVRYTVSLSTFQQTLAGTASFGPNGRSTARARRARRPLTDCRDPTLKTRMGSVKSDAYGTPPGSPCK